MYMYLVGELAQEEDVSLAPGTGPGGVESREPHHQTESQHKEKSTEVQQ